MKSFWDATDPLFSSTSALYRLSKKLKDLKPLLRNLRRQHIGDIKKKTKEALVRLCECQTATLMNPCSGRMVKEAIAFDRWSFLSQLEEKIMSQRAKLHWLSIGDGNNKQFYQAAKVREVRNSIREIKRSDGSFATSQEEIKMEAVDHFNKFLNLRPEGFTGIEEEELHALLEFECEEGDKHDLTRSVSEEEIKQVLFKMASNKSPGPDGYSCEFYKSCWQFISKNFVTAIKSFFDTGFLPKGVNSTILALIPKKHESITMGDYRPISCCNVIYKVISKILARRLKSILPKFISPNQSAFVKERLLMENVLLASELVKSYHKSNIASRCAIKIDISKAFDSVQWPFLRTVLKAIKIPDQFITWIMKCVELASFSVQVNGELAGYFNSSRGLRQGCSLSPYLFVMCMQVLSKLLDKAAMDKQFGYHPYCQELHLTHLCFGDDFLVFADGRQQSMEGILKVFQRFEEISGLSISLEKSTLFMAGVTDLDREAILSNTPLATGTLLVKYLGLPLMTKRMTTSDYSPLIE